VKWLVIIGHVNRSFYLLTFFTYLSGTPVVSTSFRFHTMPASNCDFIANITCSDCKCTTFHPAQETNSSESEAQWRLENQTKLGSPHEDGDSCGYYCQKMSNGLEVDTTGLLCLPPQTTTPSILPVIQDSECYNLPWE